MKRNILKVLISILLLPAIASCGNDYLETNYHQGVDVDNGLSSVSNIENALNGVYYRLFDYRFAGNYSTCIGDIPTDITYWNTKTGHWDKLYTYTFNDTDNYLLGIWNYGYKVADNASRVIKGATEYYPEASAAEKKTLDRCIAEAYALRGYAMLQMVNIFAHQIKVNGKDFSSSPGIVVIDEPIEPLVEVSRSTVGETYAAILSDFNNALTHFAAGDAQTKKSYMTPAAVKGLLARTYLYMENWTSAVSNAMDAITTSGLKMEYDPAKFVKLYSGGGASNTESMFFLAIDGNNNWSANSCGTLWTTYSFSPSPKLLSLYGANDIRNGLIKWDDESTPGVPIYGGGKFCTANPANATNYIVNLPEMYLIAAEAYAQQGNVSQAANMLFNVAKRDTDITSTSDLPSTKAELLEFIQDERARELFQEGLRLWDLRRWDASAEVYAHAAPSITFRHINYKISDLLFPIPSDEINSGFGVTQNDWSGTLPK